MRRMNDLTQELVAPYESWIPMSVVDPRVYAEDLNGVMDYNSKTCAIKTHTGDMTLAYYNLNTDSWFCIVDETFIEAKDVELWTHISGEPVQINRLKDFLEKELNLVISLVKSTHTDNETLWDYKLESIDSTSTGHSLPTKLGTVLALDDLMNLLFIQYLNRPHSEAPSY